MAEFIVRTLADSEIALHRQLCDAHPDPYMGVLFKHFPRYPEIARRYYPDELYAKRQRAVLGAFAGRNLIGTVSVEQTDRPAAVEMQQHEWDSLCESFSMLELNYFSSCAASLEETYINAPGGSLTLHSLAVDPRFRFRGVSRMLIREAINQLDRDERDILYAETFRISWLVRLFKSCSFVTVRKSLSISERIKYGCWGSVLMRYCVNDDKQFRVGC